jgi:hypothetical protein
MAETKKTPPCLEEFVAAGYKAENYEKHFEELRELGDSWGPTWSDPNWKAAPRLPEGIPAQLMVCSQVRKLASRTLRRQQPTRHRFKQYLFSDPSKRILRNRPVRITSDDLVKNFAELEAKEACGILAVHTLDGRRLDLASLRDGILSLSAKVPSETKPNPPLDSIANDTPTGISMAQFIDGTFDGDPAAERVLAELTAQKTAEGIRQGAIENPDTGDETDPLVDFEDPAAPVAPVEEVVEEPPPPPPPAPVSQPTPSSKLGKKRR